MDENNALSEMEYTVLQFVKRKPGCSEGLILARFSGSFKQDTQYRQAIADLVSKNYIAGSTEQPIQYSATA